jgi:hypothetical protein
VRRDFRWWSWQEWFKLVAQSNKLWQVVLLEEDLFDFVWAPGLQLGVDEAEEVLGVVVRYFVMAFFS